MKWQREAEVAVPLPKAAKKPVTPAPLAAVPVPRSNCETVPYRLRSDQIDKKNVAERLQNRAYYSVSDFKALAHLLPLLEFLRLWEPQKWIIRTI